MNLTAITQINDVVDKHFIDSLSLVKALDDLSNREIHIIDVGTGAGFPGIPLKIAFPQLTIILLDSLNKRVSFLNEVIENIGMAGIEAIHGRAEDLARMAAYRENFDLCVSRAVSNIATFSNFPPRTEMAFFPIANSSSIFSDL